MVGTHLQVGRIPSRWRSLTALLQWKIRRTGLARPKDLTVKWESSLFLWRGSSYCSCTWERG